MIILNNYEGVTPKLIEDCAAKHNRGLERMERLDAYYRGDHDILKRKYLSNFWNERKVVCNFPKYITDTAVGYTFGNPVLIQHDDEARAEALKDAFLRADTDTHGSELAKDLSVFGRGYELVYMNARSEPRVALVDPRSAFAAFDDTVENAPLFGCVIYAEANNAVRYEVYTAAEKIVYGGQAGGSLRETSRTPHHFGAVPLVEYWNNEEGMGDFETVIPLVDAYEALTSDRVNDKARFVDAILLIKRSELPEEEGAAQKILKDGILQLPGDNADAEYLTKLLNESETEVLPRALAADIHKFSQTPDFTDERFSGNVSGVALKFKLLSLEYLAKVKERFFVSGLRERVALFGAILGIAPPIKPFTQLAAQPP